MSIQLPLRVIEIVSSKICHDLISPIGAVSNGIEFMADMGGDADEEALGLISYSAAQASAKLKALRLAYGGGGADPSIKPEDIHTIFGGYIAGDGKVTQEWDPHMPLGIDEPPNGFCKLLLCCLMALTDTLPRGGNIVVQAGEDNSVQFIATGQGAAYREGYRHALQNGLSPEQLEPKSVHPFLTHYFADNYGYSIHAPEPQNDQINLRLGLS